MLCLALRSVLFDRRGLSLLQEIAKSALQRFRSCSDSVSRWMSSSNRLKLNPSKTELIWLHSSRRNPGFIQNDFEPFGNFITPVRVVRNLGVILDEI